MRLPDALAPSLKGQKRPVLGVSALIRCNQRALLVQRGQEPAKGLWSLPGGKVEWGERLEGAIRREVLEETHIALEHIAFLKHVEIIAPKHHFVISVFMADLSREIEPRAGDDAWAARWFSFQQAKNVHEAGQMTPTSWPFIRLLKT